MVVNFRRSLGVFVGFVRISTAYEAAILLSDGHSLVEVSLNQRGNKAI